MVVAISAIVAFQSYWLYKIYTEEKRLITSRANIFFHDEIFEQQGAKLMLDTNEHIFLKEKNTMVSMSRVLQRKWRDSVTKEDSGHLSLVVKVDKNDLPPADSLNRVYYRHTLPNDRVFDFLEGIDSLQDSIHVDELHRKLQTVFEKEKMPVDFSIFTDSLHAQQRVEIHSPDDNRVLLGFKKPVIYRLEINGFFRSILRRIYPQVVLSLLLVGITVISFLLLFRNWKRQQHLSLLKNELIGNITHELKTPIATVSVAIEALKHFDALEDPRKTREYLDISGNELQRLSLLVDKVLKLSMFEKKAIEFSPEIFDMNQLVEEVIASMRLQFEKYHAQVDVKKSGNDFTIVGDRTHFMSVVYNLLDNALKYSKSNPVIEVSILEQPGKLQLSVTDNGIGIPAAWKNRIFEKFFRVPTGNKHNVKGYGLGLSYVAGVVHAHQGQISVDSEEGIGSRFTITIPREHGKT